MKTQEHRNPQALIGSSRPLTTLTLLAGLLFGLAVSGLAADRNDLDQRIRKLTDEFEAMRANPGKRISPELLQQAQGIILLDGTRAGLLFAYQHAGGIAMVKDPHTGQWGPVSFVGANEASQGLQIGGVHSFTVILIMSADASWTLANPVIKLGSEVSGTAGNATGRTEGAISSLEQTSMAYSDLHGLYAGAAIKGGSIWPDTGANLAYYGLPLSAKGILFDGKVKATAAAEELAQKISEASK